MKRYEAPMVEITKFDIEDVITTSGTPAVEPTDASTLSGDAAAAAVTNIAGGTIEGTFADILSW